MSSAQPTKTTIDRSTFTITFHRTFEAPREDQQAWFVRRFGPDVNLANVAPDGALGLETFRQSLRSDTYGAPAPGPVSVRGA